MPAPTDSGRREVKALPAAAAVAVVAAMAVVGAACRRDAAAPSPTGSRATAAANPSRTVQPPRGLLGAGSCTSSGCHAAAVEGHAAWQSSYTVWSARDPHARAERVLHEPLAEQIVSLLAARDPSRRRVPAHEHTACIGCHATGRGPLAHEGVSCESCHGPAGDWLVAHTLPGWRAAGNSLGMVDLADPFVCGQQCAGCHVGGPPTADGLPREVSHDLIAAGHPRLAFELRSFKRAEPPHWQDRFATTAPRAAEAGATDPRRLLQLDPLDEWALGRLGAVRVFLDQIARQSTASTRPRSGATADIWPEFTAFDCYGCHRPPVAAGDRGGDTRDRSGQPPPGTPRLEPLHWALLDLLVPTDTAARLAAFRDGVERRWWERPDVATIEACLDAIDGARSHVHPTLAPLSTGEWARRVLAAVDATTWDEAAAAHAALEAVADRAAARGAPPDALAPARSHLERLRGLLEFPASGAGRPTRFDSPHSYDARAVAAELDAIATALESPMTPSPGSRRGL